jgi:hypothetical protein
MKTRSVALLCGVVVLLSAYVLSYCRLVSRGFIKESGRDQHILFPAWSRVAFYPAAKTVRFLDLLNFRREYTGTWVSTDKTFPYRITLDSVAFDTASGQATVDGISSSVTLRDMSHHLYREPFRNPIMEFSGTDGWYLYFKNAAQLSLFVPTGPWKDHSRPTRSILLSKVTASHA